MACSNDCPKYRRVNIEHGKYRECGVMPSHESKEQEGVEVFAIGGTFTALYDLLCRIHEEASEAVCRKFATDLLTECDNLHKKVSSFLENMQSNEEDKNN